MQIRIGEPREGLRGDLAEDYYQQSEKRNGKCLLKKISLGFLKNGEDSLFLKTFDKNFHDSSSNLQNVYESPYHDLVALYTDDNQKIIAHCLLKHPLYEDEFTATISDFCIKNENEFNDGDFPICYNIYKHMIEAIESYLISNYSLVNTLEILTDGQGGDLWLIADEKGFEIQDSGDLPGSLIRFQKPFLKKDDNYGRNLINKQN